MRKLFVKVGMKAVVITPLSWIAYRVVEKSYQDGKGASQLNSKTSIHRLHQELEKEIAKSRPIVTKKGTGDRRVGSSGLEKEI